MASQRVVAAALCRWFWSPRREELAFGRLAKGGRRLSGTEELWVLGTRGGGAATPTD